MGKACSIYITDIPENKASHYLYVYSQDERAAIRKELLGDGGK